MKIRILAAGALVVASTVAAQAASISVTTFSTASYLATFGTFSTAVVEDFEGYVEGNVTDGFSTSVGTFKTVGGTGTGGTVTNTVAQGNFAGNDGSKLAIRDGNVFGRSSTTDDLTGIAAHDKFLDSNDTHGIEWTVSVGSMFDKILLTLTDATDVGATMKISAGGMTKSFSGLGNANTQMVLIDFGGAVGGATVLFENFKGSNYKLNDGFSLDDIAVSAIPLPAPALMLLGGLGALGALRRRKRTA